MKMRKDGTYEKKINIGGKRYSVYAKSKSELEQKEFNLRSEVAQGINLDKKSLTVNNLFEEYLKYKSEGKKNKKATIYENRTTYNRIKPYLGDKKLSSLSRNDVIQARTKLENQERKLNNRTINKTIEFLREVMNYGVDEGYISKNPCRRIPNLEDNVPKARDTIHKALTIEEVKRFVEAAKDEEYREFFELILCTGLRCEEAAALIWDDIDFEHNIIHITHTISRYGTNDFERVAPKTESSLRDIPLQPLHREILLRQLRKSQSIIKEDYVFQKSKGIYPFITIQNANYALKKILKKADVKGNRGSHALRATFATLLSDDISLNVLMELLGHTDPRITRLYAQITDDKKTTEMKAVNDIYANVF